ncbi:MAG TPA: hypothetical protein VK894_04005 [Jiangellales bacterium]|nr:hypothetical protein [Jiangellales bacterium]
MTVEALETLDVVMLVVAVLVASTFVLLITRGSGERAPHGHH